MIYVICGLVLGNIICLVVLINSFAYGRFLEHQIRSMNEYTKRLDKDWTLLANKMLDTRRE